MHICTKDINLLLSAHEHIQNYSKYNIPMEEWTKLA